MKFENSLVNLYFKKGAVEFYAKLSLSEIAISDSSHKRIMA